MALPILLKPVNSQMLSEAGYLPQARTLFVRFRGNGAVYAYFGVPAEVNQELLASRSIGRFMQQRIFKHYYSARISQGELKKPTKEAA
ncbi:KTSC domain-containing protein [Lewinellaceae bacterium SD302]|nr:KTSC domain-containing protein [Lewinellaceae bacterium SD302]